MDKCVVYGVRTPYVHEVIESVRRANITISAFIDNLPDKNDPLDLRPLASPENIDPDWLNIPIVFGTITPGFRKSMHKEVIGLGFSSFLTLIDPTSILSSSVSVAAGVQINTAAVIGANSTLNKFALVNRSASVGHDVVLASYATLGPGCVLCGSTTVGAGCFIGAGAIITPGRSIGKNSIVGAGAVVTKDVPDNCLVVGNLARVSKTNIAGYNGVSV